MSKLAINGGKPVRTKTWPAWPYSDEKEIRAITEVTRSNKWWRGAYNTGELGEGIKGKSKVEKFEETFAGYHGVKYGIAVSSGLAALDVALKAANIGPGDEVIVPAYTFIATATCVLHVNAVPIFADVEPDTYNIDPHKIEEAITDKTRAIIPVHFAGNLANMQAINKIAKKYNLIVIEDAAHAHGVERTGGKMAGTFGDMGIFSFQSSKNMTCGEGGILITDNEKYADLAYSLHHYGRNRKGLWYQIFRLGWNFRMTEFQAAILLVQLKRLRHQNALRMKNAHYLTEKLKQIEGVEPLKVDPGVTRHSYHLYIFQYNKNGFGGLPREKFIAALNAEGIPCQSGYTFPVYANPLFLNKDFHKDRCPVECVRYGKKIDYASFAKKCPVAEAACYEKAVWFEHRLLLAGKKDMEDIVSAILKIKKNVNCLMN